MARVPLPIGQGFYVDESLPVSAQSCVNCYPHIPKTKTITDAAVIGVSGIDFALESYSTTQLRGLHVMNGVAYFIKDDKLYSLTYTEDTFGVRTYAENLLSATTISGSGQCVMANNGIQLMIVSPDYNNQFNAWVYSTATTTLVQVSDADFDGPVNYVTYYGGYFLFAKADSNKFFSSDLRDGLTYVALDFSSAESDPDNIVSMAVLNNILYIMGTAVTEQWQNVPVGSGFPFVSIVSGGLQKGCLAPRSLIDFGGSLVWIGSGRNEQPAIWSTSGAEPQRLSTPAIDNLINSGGVTKLAEAYALTWSTKGHTFVCFNVPEVCSVVYDLSTGLWHTRESFDSSGNVIPWRVSGIVTAYSVQIVSDNIDGRIGIMNDETYTEYGSNINSYFVCPAIDNNGNPFTVNSVEMMMETGTCDIDQSPVVRMAVSTDGGRTFLPEISRDLGLTGDYERRISWDLLGRYSRSFTPKFICDEPIKKVFVKGEMSIGN